MIRRLIILLLIVGCVFAQTEDNSSLDKILLINETIFEGEYISMDDDNIIFKPKGSIAGQSIDKTKVKLVTLADGTIIFGIKTYNIDNKIKIIDMARIGGVFLAVGGALLYSNINKEPPELIGTSSSALEQLGKDMEQFNDDIKLTASIGYGCIIIGGILITIGEVDSELEAPAP